MMFSGKLCQMTWEVVLVDLGSGSSGDKDIMSKMYVKRTNIIVS